MSDLQKAYSILGLEPGAPMDVIQRRYKRLIMVWHPDRFPNDEGKKDAEEELKKINNARDLLKAHFESGHSESSTCDCRAGSSEETRHQHAPGSTGPGRKARNTDDSRREEWAAQKKDEERSKRAEEEDRQKADQAANAAHEQTVDTALRAESERKSEPLRWKISLGCMAAFAVLSIVSAVSDPISQPILAGENVVLGQSSDTDKSRQLAQDWQNYQNDKAQVATTLFGQDSAAGAGSWQPPFVSNDNSADSYCRNAYQQLVVKVDEKKKQHAMAVYQARSDVDRYEKAIERSKSMLAEVDGQLADPSRATSDQRNALEDQTAQRKYLEENTESLRVAQQHLDELEAESPGAVPLEPRFGPAPVPISQEQVPSSSRLSPSTSTTPMSLTDILKSPTGPAFQPDSTAPSDRHFYFKKQLKGQ